MDPAGLLGHDAVLRPLLAAARRGRAHPCLLFEGPPGVGKGSAARLLARALACEAPPERRPCDACPTCRQVLTGNHPDVVVVEPEAGGRSRRIRVGQAREIVRMVGLRPYNARRRTVIFDPADALGVQAANALLKTFEEPPDDTGFILVTARPSSLLVTVRSRCQSVRFAALDESALAGWLEARGIEGARRLARLGQGCPGRALSLAEGKTLARLDGLRDALLDAVGGGPAAVLALAEGLTRKQAGLAGRERALEALDVLETLVRDAVLLGAGAEGLLHEDRAERLRTWAERAWPGGLHRVARAIRAGRRRLEQNVPGRLVLEAVLTRADVEVRRPG